MNSKINNSIPIQQDLSNTSIKGIPLEVIKDLIEYYKEDYERAIGINFSTNASMETTIYDGGEDDAIAGCQAFEELYNDLKRLIGEEVQDV